MVGTKPEHQLPSVYSLTLDEFHNSLTAQKSKAFGSMNIDEFLNSIWMVEDNQTQGSTSATTIPVQQLNLQENNMPTVPTPQRQTSLPRQSSFSIPDILGSKTVDEIWFEIQRSDVYNNLNNQPRDDRGNHGPIQITNPAPPSKQPTFGNMTLEDFLARAGIDCEPSYPQLPQPQQPQQPPLYFPPQQPQQPPLYFPPQQPQQPPLYFPPQQSPFGMYPNIEHLAVGSYYAARQVMTMGGGVDNAVNYQGSDMKAPSPAPSASYGGRFVGSCRGGYGEVRAPVTSNGMGPSQVDSGNKYGLETGRMRRRKRNINGTLKNVEERSQERILKNREWAAQSTARKQARVVDLQLELSQIRVENEKLKQLLADLENKLHLQYYEEEEAREKATMQPKSPKPDEKSTALRRGFSSSY